MRLVVSFPSFVRFFSFLLTADGTTQDATRLRLLLSLPAYGTTLSTTRLLYFADDTTQDTNRLLLCFRFTCERYYAGYRSASSSVVVLLILLLSYGTLLYDDYLLLLRFD